MLLPSTCNKDSQRFSSIRGPCFISPNPVLALLAVAAGVFAACSFEGSPSSQGVLLFLELPGCLAIQSVSLHCIIIKDMQLLTLTISQSSLFLSVFDCALLQGMAFNSASG